MNASKRQEDGRGTNSWSRPGPFGHGPSHLHHPTNPGSTPAVNVRQFRLHQTSSKPACHAERARHCPLSTRYSRTRARAANCPFVSGFRLLRSVMTSDCTCMNQAAFVARVGVVMLRNGWGSPRATGIFGMVSFPNPLPLPLPLTSTDISSCQKRFSFDARSALR